MISAQQCTTTTVQLFSYAGDAVSIDQNVPELPCAMFHCPLAFEVRVVVTQLPATMQQH